MRKDGARIATVGGSLLANSLQRRATCWTSYRCLNRCFPSTSSTCPGPIGLCTGRLTNRTANIIRHDHERVQSNPCYRSFLLKTCFFGRGFSWFPSASSAKCGIVPVSVHHSSYHSLYILDTASVVKQTTTPPPQ